MSKTKEIYRNRRQRLGFFDGAGVLEHVPVVLDNIPPRVVLYSTFAVVASYTLINIYRNRYGAITMNKSAELFESAKTKAEFIYTFFCGKKNDNKISMKIAMDNYNDLTTQIGEEIEQMREAILQKQRSDININAIAFVDELQVMLSEYPRLPSDVKCVAEVEQAIAEKSRHHAKIKVAVEQFLSTVPNDEAGQDEIEKAYITTSATVANDDAYTGKSEKKININKEAKEVKLAEAIDAVDKTCADKFEKTFSSAHDGCVGKLETTFNTKLGV